MSEAGDIAWSQWRRQLAELRAGLDTWRAESVAWGHITSALTH
jgi:hypothetical protein